MRVILHIKFWWAVIGLVRRFITGKEYHFVSINNAAVDILDATGYSYTHNWPWFVSKLDWFNCHQVAHKSLPRIIKNAIWK